MYWSAHVGTQENGWHGVMKNGTQSSNKESLILIAPGKLIMPCELVRRHIPSCSRKFDVKIQNLEILDVGDYNISETITTTETWVAPFGSVTLAVELS